MKPSISLMDSKRCNHKDSFKNEKKNKTKGIKKNSLNNNKYCFTKLSDLFK